MNYVIEGGEFNNKGAEAMTLVAIYNIRKYDSDARIYMHCDKPIYGDDLEVTYYKVPEWFLRERHGGYKSQVAKCKVKNFIKYFVPGKNAISPKEARKEISKTEHILADADVMINISGFKLGDKFGREEIHGYLTWINQQKKLNPRCRIYLMPQSFGPFEKCSELKKEIKETLEKCELIYAREEGGYKGLLDLGLTNVSKSMDSVIVESDYKADKTLNNYSHYCEDLNLVTGRKIAIIPNHRLAEMGGQTSDELVKFYCDIISSLIDKCSIYLISHAGEDLKICKRIKNEFDNSERVVFVDHVLSSFNFENAVAGFDYIIASRYHSIIHSYKQGTPAIILGWSEKYNELAEAFSQQQYNHLFGKTDFAKILDQMENKYSEERETILIKLQQIQNFDCYSYLK